MNKKKDKFASGKYTEKNKRTNVTQETVQDEITQSQSDLKKRNLEYIKKRKKNINLKSTKSLKHELSNILPSLGAIATIVGSSCSMGRFSVLIAAVGVAAAIGYVTKVLLGW